MRTAPVTPSAAEVLSAVRRCWSPTAQQAVHLPLGFGAHHWRIDAAHGPTLFATLDHPSPTRSVRSFLLAYRAARELAEAGLPGVLAPAPASASVPGADGEVATALAGGLLSVTPWQSGRTPSAQEAARPQHLARTLALLDGLHGTTPPPHLPAWSPRVAPALPDRLAESTRRSWDAGPLGDQARALLRAAAPRIARSDQRYRELADRERAQSEHRVPTHGEPHHGNQMLLPDGTLLLVDWETLGAAPRERDLAALPRSVQRARRADPAMIELFELEWMLSEVEEYQRWFRAPHTGDEDDRIALQGLREELS